jgi:hypothetical protein
MEKLLGKGSAIGKTMQRPTDIGVFNLKVCGVIKEYQYGNMYYNSSPVIFYCLPQEAQLLYVRCKAGTNTELLLSKIQQVIKANNPAYPFEYKFVDDSFNEKFLAHQQIVACVCFACNSYFLSRVIRSCRIYCRTKNKRNRHQESTWRKRHRHRCPAFKGVYKTGLHFLHRGFSACLVADAQLAAGLSLSYRNKYVCFCDRRRGSSFDSPAYGKFPGNKSGNLKPGKKFEDRVAFYSVHTRRSILKEYYHAK